MADNAKTTLLEAFQSSPFLPIVSEIMENAPQPLSDPVSLQHFLLEHDGAAQLVPVLREHIRPAEVADETSQRRVWELFALYFRNQGRFHEALPIVEALYEHMLTHQHETLQRIHKGLPLVLISDCHAGLDHPVHAKRYLMLTLCEDAITDTGQIDLKKTGSYSRLVWYYGLPHEQVGRYANECWKLYDENGNAAAFPEWVLQQVDQEWMTEVPSANEVGLYKISGPYAKWLLDHTDDNGGENLECLSQYLIGAMPGCRALRRVGSEVSDYDVVATFEGSFMDFRSELGRYFLVECKDWTTPADFTTIAKFCRVLDSAKCRFGILFSQEGVSGQKATRFGQREIVKVFQDRAIIIVAVTKADLERIVSGQNFITMLRSKYEKVRLDLRGPA